MKEICPFFDWADRYCHVFGVPSEKCTNGKHEECKTYAYAIRHKSWHDFLRGRAKREEIELLKCIKCGDVLTGYNWYASYRNSNQKLCKECAKEYRRRYYRQKRERKVPTPRQDTPCKSVL